MRFEWAPGDFSMPREIDIDMPGLLNEAFPVVLLMPHPVPVWREV